MDLAKIAPFKAASQNSKGKVNKRLTLNVGSPPRVLPHLQSRVTRHFSRIIPPHKQIPHFLVVDLQVTAKKIQRLLGENPERPKRENAKRERTSTGTFRGEVYLKQSGACKFSLAPVDGNGNDSNGRNVSRREITRAPDSVKDGRAFPKGLMD